MNHIEELEKQREKCEDNLVLQSEVMELLEQRDHRLNGHGKNGKNGKNNGGRLKRLLLMK